jgi:hypothetical protein
VITHELLDEMLEMSRTVGKLQWKLLGGPALNDAAHWLGCMDRAVEATRDKSFGLAIENVETAKEIEAKWPEFNMVAERVINVLRDLS